LALAFDFLNGLHDAANSVATIVSTRVLSPRTAVAWAAFFNFIAFLVFPTNVAHTIAGDIVDPQLENSLSFFAAALVAACLWNILTWYLGLPTSSSHALIGGMAGVALAETGSFSSWRPGLGLVVLYLVLAPLIGFVLGTLIATAVAWLFRRTTPRRVDAIFRRGQFVSAALLSLGHGGNDAQKTMGIIFMLLIGYHAQQQGLAAGAHPISPITHHEITHIPIAVVVASQLAMGLGTMFGGWRIVKTMGQRIIRLRPVDGFCAELGAALTLAFTIFVKGVPISTTHTITGSIVGVGSLKRLSAVRWGVAGRVVWAWVLTIPGAGILAALCWWILQIGQH
ncbi:MAG TPA: inorganic phosphate transporter, partial [Gemmataceae bacterium]|nr:inorganic phosphate transporter [Gemmataceae bacterium]